MHYIVDSNYLINPLLRAYLKASRNNKVVIIDFVMMEAYKRNSIPLMSRLMAILCEFPDQVIILKNTTAIGALRGRKAGLTRRMIAQTDTAEFKTFCHALQQAANGNKWAIKSFQEHAEAADMHFQEAIKDLNEFTPALQDIAAGFSREERKDIRFNTRESPETSPKLARFLMQIYDKFRISHPLRPKAPNESELVNTFIFRSAVASLIFLLNWIRTGMQKQIDAKKHSNDIVDMIFAVYGTYFDGILTEDKKLLALYAELLVALEVFSSPSKRTEKV